MSLPLAPGSRGEGEAPKPPKPNTVPGVLKVEELLTYENRQNGRSIAKLLGGVAGAAVLLAVASGRSHSVSRRAAA